VVAVHLPQLEPVIHDGVSGFLVPRHGSRDDMATAVAERFVDVRDAIAAGRLEPKAIAGSIADFTPNTQLARVYRYHKEIQNERAFTAAAASY
jgi:hypothetical protein